MADGSGGGAGMGVIVGALVVVVAIIGVVVFGGNFASNKSVDVNVHAPATSAPSAPTPK